ncbi:MAG TPA: sulfotransferase [Solirubrobacteraceae bacterium]|nr:sulfotransferase [Solirubrobacteraceae bacterium]
MSWGAVPLPARRRLLGIRDWAYRSRIALGKAPGPRTSEPPDRALESVVILGMHRSGTSLVTRLVSLLGLAVCRDEDLLAGRKANPRGHWESKSLLDFNERLLDELGGAWFCPPALGAPELARMLRRHRVEALARVRDAHPRRPWVWKDPRTCVLLAFWSAVLEQRAAYVLVVRHPLEVSDSLARRDRYAPALSLALWERYTRAAMLGAAGRPTIVCTYDDVLADPVAWCKRLVAFLAGVGVCTGDADWPAVEAFAMAGLRHSRQSWTDLARTSAISPAQLALAQAASQFTAQESYQPPALPAETPATEAVFEQIRRHGAPRGRRRAHVVGLPADLRVGKAASGGGDDATRPPVSVVLACGRAAAEESLRVLAPTLPPGSEVLVLGDERAPAGNPSDLDGLSVRRVQCERPPSTSSPASSPQWEGEGESEALALGAQAARGTIVLLACAQLVRCDQWYEPAKRALGSRHVVGVAPVTRCSARPDERRFGFAFNDEDLLMSARVGSNAKGPVPAALLGSALCACNRSVLVAAGGVDGAFSSASAAVAELSVRLWRMGFRCCILPQVEAWIEEGKAGSASRSADAEQARAGSAAHAADAEEAQAGGASQAEDAELLYDRLRIAALHFDEPRLNAFTERASRLPGYEVASERLAASDVQRRRAQIAAVCAFSIERYFQSFPL